MIEQWNSLSPGGKVAVGAAAVLAVDMIGNVGIVDGLLGAKRYGKRRTRAQRRSMRKNVYAGGAKRRRRRRRRSR